MMKVVLGLELVAAEVGQKKEKENKKKEEITGRNRSSDLPIELSRWLLAQCRYAPLTPFAFYTVLLLLNMLFGLRVISIQRLFILLV